MTTLQFLAALSVAITIGFTIVMAFSAPGPGQTRQSALVEAWINVVIGFSINFVANFAFFPLLGLNITAGQNFCTGCIFTAISVLRSYVIRRWFNARIVALARKLAS